MDIDIAKDENLISQIQRFAKSNNFTDEATKPFSNIFDNLAKQESIDSTIAKRFGQYFYYYAQIDEILTNIIKSLLPELDISIMGLDSSLDRNSFLKKIELVKSLTPNSNQLKVFPLLKKLNTVRNKIAHASPEMIDLTKINQELISAFKEAFFSDEVLFQKISTLNKSNDHMSIPVKVILATKMYLELFAGLEIFGKREDKHLKFFEALRKVSSLYVRRRFSILAFQMQTKTKSSEVPDDFKKIDDFKLALEKLSESFKDFF